MSLGQNQYIIFTHVHSREIHIVGRSFAGSMDIAIFIYFISFKAISRIFYIINLRCLKEKGKKGLQMDVVLCAIFHNLLY